MAFYRKHPYERANAERGREDTVKTFKNHNKALSTFALVTVLMIFGNLLLYIYIFPEIDLSPLLAVIICIILSTLIQKTTYIILNKLFKDPSKGVYIMTYLVVGPFLLAFILFANTLITFESPEEKIEILDYHHEVHYSRRRTMHLYLLNLEGDKFKYQRGFRTLNSPPNAKYITYEFRRGILGFRILESRTLSD